MAFKMAALSVKSLRSNPTHQPMRCGSTVSCNVSRKIFQDFLRAFCISKCNMHGPRSTNWYYTASCLTQGKFFLPSTSPPPSTAPLHKSVEQHPTLHSYPSRLQISGTLPWHTSSVMHALVDENDEKKTT